MGHDIVAREPRGRSDARALELPAHAVAGEKQQQGANDAPVDEKGIHTLEPARSRPLAQDVDEPLNNPPDIRERSLAQVRAPLAISRNQSGR